MGVDGVIAVDTVLEQKLPVGADAVFLFAADHFHPVRAVLVEQVENAARICEIVLQGDRASIIIDEIEAAIFGELRHFFQVRAAIVVEVLGIAAGLHPGGEVAIIVEGPAMIKALEAKCIAPGFAFDHGAAMRAGVEEGVELALPVAIEDQLLAADIAGHEIVRPGQFRLMAEIEPAAIEYPVALLGEDLLIGEGPAVDPEQSLLPVIQDKSGCSCLLAAYLSDAHRGLLSVFSVLCPSREWAIFANIYWSYHLLFCASCQSELRSKVVHIDCIYWHFGRGGVSLIIGRTICFFRQPLC